MFIFIFSLPLPRNFRYNFRTTYIIKFQYTQLKQVIEVSLLLQLKEIKNHTKIIRLVCYQKWHTVEFLLYKSHYSLLTSFKFLYLNPTLDVPLMYFYYPYRGSLPTLFKFLHSPHSSLVTGCVIYHCQILFHVKLRATVLN